MTQPPASHTHKIFFFLVFISGEMPCGERRRNTFPPPTLLTFEMCGGKSRKRGDGENISGKHWAITARAGFPNFFFRTALRTTCKSIPQTANITMLIYSFFAVTLPRPTFGWVGNFCSIVVKKDEAEGWCPEC